MSEKESIHEFAKAHPEIKTPYYIADESLLLRNLEKIKYVREKSGAKSVLALKAFSMWSVFPLMSQYMDGTTSSAIYEARLGKEKFGGETQAYSVVFTAEEVKEAIRFADKIIFNSISQLEAFYDIAKGIPVGLRANPGVSYSHFDLADPARKLSRLGVRDIAAIEKVADKLTGLMFHVNCENNDFAAYSKLLDGIGNDYGDLLKKMEWVSLGGGVAFTSPRYPLEDFAARLKKFAADFDVQVYLEPGDAAVTMAGYLVTQVRDIVDNDGKVAIINAAVETHMLDNLIYKEDATIVLPQGGPHTYMVAGNTCLAGDVWGTYGFPEPLKVGDYVIFDNALRYTMVKMNWFNGVQMPGIVVKRLDGTVDVVREFTYDDFRSSLS
jgi:carboxynorspermidine decarboxylase